MLIVSSVYLIRKCAARTQAQKQLHLFDPLPVLTLIFAARGNRTAYALEVCVSKCLHVSHQGAPLRGDA